jgi:DNA-binding MurR/RpiR family transcriptional regulator
MKKINRKAHKLDEAEFTKIHNLINYGISLTEVARITGWSKSLVGRVAKYANYEAYQTLLEREYTAKKAERAAHGGASELVIPNTDELKAATEELLKAIDNSLASLDSKLDEVLGTVRELNNTKERKNFWS